MTAQESRSLTALFDADIFAIQRRGGISNYFMRLIEQFGGRSEYRVRPMVPPALIVNQHAMHGRLLHVPPLPGFGKVWPTLDRATMWATDHSGRRADVYHSTFYLTPLRRTRAKKRVVTVHDMIPELFPEYFPEGNPHGFKREHVESADVVICVSESTRRDLERVYGRIEQPVVVSPLAVSAAFRPPTVEPGRSDYILFVGQRDGYKDFSTFVEVCAVLKDEGVRGVVVGAKLSGIESEMIEANNVSDSVTHTKPNNEELAALYQGAAAFVFPSRYEGFGLPTLEAMASGCPVVLARTPALEEVAGDAGVLCEPGDVDGFADAIRRLRADEVWRATKKKQGLARSALFSWERTAQLTAEAYAL